MDIDSFLSAVTKLPGTPGFEAGVNKYISEAIRPFADEVRIDAMQNVIATKKGDGPVIMISAHQDEIGLVVTKIEDDGCVRFSENGGVDPRILPASEVRIITKRGELFGVVGAKPPHVMSRDEMNKPYDMDELYIDTGLSCEQVKSTVRIGDPIVFTMPVTKLENGRLAGKTMDDRACVCAMIECAEIIKRLNPRATVHYVASTQEEIGAMGAETAAFALNPVFAIAIDVTHGAGPGTGKWEAFDLDKVAITYGPTIHKGLYDRMKSVADKWRIPYSVEISGNYTGTDADEIYLKRSGIPCALVSVPLRYMHTTVETLDANVIHEAARLMALFIDDMARSWGDWKWY